MGWKPMPLWITSHMQLPWGKGWLAGGAEATIGRVTDPETLGDDGSWLSGSEKR
jgi:hypothetical protein